jgi:uncharacterized protein (TIGR02996 family)
VTKDALLEAIRREPEDDLVRLVYADWLDEYGDPERAEFIRVQIEAERHRKGSPECTRLTDRAVELLKSNGREWACACEPAIPPGAVLEVCKTRYAGEYGLMLLKGSRVEVHGRAGWRELYSKMWFHRGFVEEIEFTPEKFFAVDPSAIQPVGPLPALHLKLCHRDDALGTLANFVGRLASAPLLDRFSEVSIIGGFGSTTPEGLHLLANESILLAKLRALRLSEDPVGDPDVLPLLESSHLTRLRDLTIDATRCTPAIVDLLLRSKRFRNMTYLHLGEIIEGARGLRLLARPGLWPRLRWLDLNSCGLDDLTLKALMRPGAFPALEALNLSNNIVHYSALRALMLSGALPYLSWLGIGATPLTLDEMRALRAEFGQRVEIAYHERRRDRPASAETPSDPPASLP